MLLALDASSKFVGWAIFDGKKLVAWGNEKITATYFWRLPAIERVLNQLVSQKLFPIDEIAMEAPGWGRTKAAYLFVVANGIGIWAKSKKLPLAKYAPSSIKKSVTGHGDTTKKDVAWFLRLEYPELKEDTLGHATDSVGVAVCHREAMRRKVLGI